MPDAQISCTRIEPLQLVRLLFSLSGRFRWRCWYQIWSLKSNHLRRIWTWWRHETILISTMSNLLIVLLCSLFIISSGFNVGIQQRISRSTLRMSLQLETINIPLQLNPRDYFQRLKEIVPEKDIIRWYIARIENGCAVVEVVRDIVASGAVTTK